ncbi:HNH endonuclease signature motif containing protein [Levilactobacillus brevis]|uniref:HNH endonuclease signature motif containing protein n=1 Tax=Levilactobacillus brevis TaxID=1580 RepID=UPI0021A59733|nr:HNH endonuclease signature motif containing protein [Levilactobacillus brevis]MCT3575464.1 HNH endonuclease [Levilactobacillus brevis]
MAKPMKQCNHAGCRQLVPYDVRYCDKHQHKANAETYHKRMYGEHEGRYQQFYKSSQWRKLSRRFLENNPICVQCYQDGVIRKADVVDHIVELRDDWSRRLDESNLQPLCYRHHNQKTKQARETRSKEASIKNGGKA